MLPIWRRSRRLITIGPATLVGTNPTFVAVADFIHVLCYLYLAGWAAGLDEPERQRLYRKWMRDCWHGRVKEVMAEMACGQ